MVGGHKENSTDFRVKQFIDDFLTKNIIAPYVLDLIQIHILEVCVRYVCYYNSNADSM